MASSRKAVILRAAVMAVALTLFSGVVAAQTGGDKKATSTKTDSSTKKSSSKTKLVDINAASKDELVAVGLDDAAAQKIVSGRPFKNKREILTRNIVDDATYEKVKDKIIAHGGRGKKAGKKGN